MAEKEKKSSVENERFALSSYSYPTGEIVKVETGDTTPTLYNEPFFEFACVQYDTMRQ